MNISIGYHIENTSVEEKRALSDAFELLRKAKHVGSETRAWAKKTHLESRLLLARIRKDAGITAAVKLWEIACFESKMLGCLRSYMNETSELMNDVKPLNPPLRTDQIKPFMEAMQSDRNVTIQALEPLSEILAELAIYKSSHQTPNLNASSGYSA